MVDGRAGKAAARGWDVARSIYRSPEGQRVVEGVYNTAVASLPAAVEERWVPTRFGTTHLLVTGPAEAPPLVVLSGGNFPGPMSLRWFAPSLRRHRVYAPDTVGHPGKSAQTRLSPRDDSYGRWLVDVLDACELDRPAMLGPSFGAGIVLATAATAPHRLDRAALVMPAGLAKPAMTSMLSRLAGPMVAYRLRPSRPRLVRAVRPLFTDPRIDDDVLDAVGAVFDHVRLATGMPRPRTAEELAALDAPVLVIAAEHDVLFPGAAVVARARAVLPNLVGAELLPGSGHIPSASAFAGLRARLAAFFDACEGHAPSGGNGA